MLAQPGSVGGVVLAPLAAHAVGRDELGCHQPDRVAVLRKQPGPVMRARAGLHADRASQQRRDQLVQLDPGHARPHQHRLAVLVDTVDRENVLGEIDPDVQNGHDFPFRVSR
jgi:hypothetical protein